MPYSTCLQGIYGAGSKLGPDRSLEFDGSTDYLSMSDANWGSYDRAKFALAGAFYIDSFASNNPIMARDEGPSGLNREFYLDITNSNELAFLTYDASGSLEGRGKVTSVTYLPATWYAYLVYFDVANAIAGNRMKLFINGADLTTIDTGPVTAPPTRTITTTIGHYPVPNTYLNGLLYQPTFFSGTLPDPADVFNGTSGALKDLSVLPGAYSLLDATTPTNDAILATDWTNNGSVTTSSDRP